MAKVNPAISLGGDLSRWREFRRDRAAGFLQAARGRRDVYRDRQARGIYYIGGPDETTAHMVIDTRIGAYTHTAKPI